MHTETHYATVVMRGGLLLMARLDDSKHRHVSANLLLTMHEGRLVATKLIAPIKADVEPPPKRHRKARLSRQHLERLMGAARATELAAELDKLFSEVRI